MPAPTLYKPSRKLSNGRPPLTAGRDTDATKPNEDTVSRAGAGGEPGTDAVWQTYQAKGTWQYQAMAHKTVGANNSRPFRHRTEASRVASTHGEAVVGYAKQAR